MQNKIRAIFGITIGILLFTTPLGIYADTSTNADFSQGARDWANNCARCHNLRSPSEFPPDQWQVIMQHMRIQCGLTGKEARNILAFLTGRDTSPAASNTTQNAKNATTPNSASADKSKHSTSSTNGESGQMIYHQTCVVCHGSNGKGAVPGAPDFTSKNSPLNKSDAILLQRIENGFQSPGSPMAMPPRGGNPKLTNHDLKKVLKYIKKEFGK